MGLSAEQYVLSMEKNLLRKLDAQQEWYDEKWKREYPAGEARKLYDMAEAAKAEGKYTEACSYYRYSEQVLGKTDVVFRWKIMECQILDGEGYGAKWSYEKATEGLWARTLKDASKEAIIEELIRKQDQALADMKAMLSRVTPAQRSAWEREMKELLARYEVEHPLSEKDKQYYEIVREKVEKMTKGTDVTFDEASFLRALRKEGQAGAAYYIGRMYDYSNGVVSAGGYNDCGKLLGQYPADICVRALEGCLKSKSVKLAKIWAERLKAYL